MNATISTSLKINLLEKKYLASRIACSACTISLATFLFGEIGSLWIVAFFLGFIGVFVYQFVFQNYIVNAILGSILALTGFYFSMGVWSEFTDFEVVNNAARQLLIVGWLICSVVITFGVLMIRTFIRDL